MLSEFGTIDVLDKGYVRLRDWMGDDLSVVNAARVSFDKRATWTVTCPVHCRAWHEKGACKHEERSLRKKDQRLLNFLAEHNHKLPFAHATLSYEVYAPLIVARQWFKHRIGSVYTEEGDLIEAWADMPHDPTESWNESSRRYVTDNNEFYVPNEWRSAPDNRKQGSGDPIDPDVSKRISASLREVIEDGQYMYDWQIENNIAPEQARLFLPYAALYIRFMWTCSLLRVIEYLKLRDAEDAQSEIQEYARAIRIVTEPKFPNSFAAWFPAE